jgi:hypothetical protein
MKSTLRTIGRWVLGVSLAMACSGPLLAQEAEEPEETINYAYSTWLGTGIYKFGERRIYVLRGNFSYSLRQPQEDQWGWELLLPATLGLNDFTDLDAEIATVTFSPGVEAQIPISAKWLLKPFGQIGFGKDFSGGDPSFIWGYGVKGLGNYPTETMELDLGAGITYANHSQSGSRGDDGFTKFDLGVNTRWPMGFTIQDRKTFINAFFVYSEFINDIELLLPLEDNIDIERLFKFGITLEGRPSFAIWFITFRGLGFDFTFGNNFRGVGLTTGFPF